MAVVVVLALPAASGEVEAQDGSRCGDYPWCDPSMPAGERADLLLDRMTRDEKVVLMAGDDLFGSIFLDPAIGFNREIVTPRYTIPATFYNDGGAGLRVRNNATGLPAPVAQAATFDREMNRRLGGVLGAEGAARRTDFVLAPAINQLRVYEWGRAFEVYGEDPYLAGELGAENVKGIQAQGPVATPKHFVGNNQDTDRATIDARIGERALNELYLPAFEKAVDAGAGSFMTAYNQVNGEFMGASCALTRDVLKERFGFDGLVMTDWLDNAPLAGMARCGASLEMPIWDQYTTWGVADAVNRGVVDEANIDAQARRILITMFEFGIFDRPEYPRNGAVDRAANSATSREAAEGGTVLLKNEDDVLPLDPSTTGSVAVIGKAANEYLEGGGSSAATEFLQIKPLQGIRDRAARDGITVSYDDGLDTSRAATAARNADTAIVVVGTNSSEFGDRQCLTFDCDATQNNVDALVEAVAAANPRTVVVLQTPSPIVLPWNERVPAIVESWYGGQEQGAAMARVLFGDVDPGGRLPVSWLRSPDQLSYTGNPEQFPGTNGRVEYAEGVFTGYRWFDEQDLEPLFPFGHGLSYTEFSFSDLRVSEAKGGRKATFTVSNTGDRAGYAVPQLYLGKPDVSAAVQQPPRWLKGFEKVYLEAGESRRLTMTLRPRDFQYYDGVSDRWRTKPGCYEVQVGASSRDLPLQATTAAGGGSCGRR